VVHGICVWVPSDADRLRAYFYWPPVPHLLAIAPLCIRVHPFYQVDCTSPVPTVLCGTIVPLSRPSRKRTSYSR
jgi:hypothetical protein